MQATVDALVAKARIAQRQVENWPQQRVDEVVRALGWWAYEGIADLAELAVRETGIGDIRDTAARHRKRVLGVLRDLEGASTVGEVESTPNLGLHRIAKPVGLIAAITPATAPTAAIAQNALLVAKTRNAAIFCPHPSARMAARRTVERLCNALRQVGAPVDLLQTVDDPDRDTATQLMTAADLVLAAGGAATVRRAYSTGTPAYGAGTGNAVVVVDESAHLEGACEKICAGKAFDNGTSCSSESSLVVVESIWDTVVANLQRNGAYVCDAEEAQRLRELVWPEGGRIRRDAVGRSAEVIARRADIAVPPGTRVLIAVGTPDSAANDPIAREKLSPILALWRARDFAEAIELVRVLTTISGRGHSCGIHTRKPERVAELAEAARVSRVMVNQSTGFGNSGNFDNGLPFTSVLCCGSWGGSISTENVTWRHLLNYTWVSEPIEERVPDVQSLFSRHWARYGKDVFGDSEVPRSQLRQSTARHS